MTLLKYWERLPSITKLTFEARSKSPKNSGWNGKGAGTVTTTKSDANTLLFYEEGTWQGKEGPATHFTNTFRWLLEPTKNTIALEHLRFGHEKPVFLFHLTATTDSTLTSQAPHQCGEDTYTGHAILEKGTITLTWTVKGPKKDEQIKYYYS